MNDFETIYDKVEMDCRCEDIASQEEGHRDRFHYKQVEAMVDKLLKDSRRYDEKIS